MTGSLSYELNELQGAEDATIEGDSEDRLNWRKTRRSTNGGNCVEVGNLTGGIAVRDTTARELGHLLFSRSSFADLTQRIQNDQLVLQP